MPQLDPDPVDMGEGMHIIFAPQATPLRRRPEDLTAFERTVFNHLGLTHPRALLSQLESLKETQEPLETRLAENLTVARRNLDGEIETLERQRSTILGAPPWGNDLTPSVAQSENKARNLITEITAKEPDDDLDGASLEALLDSADDALIEKRDQDQSELEAQSSALANRRVKLEYLRGHQTNIVNHQSELLKVQVDPEVALQGKSLDELQEDFKHAQAEASYAAIKRQIVDAVVSLLDREANETMLCPICETEHNKHYLGAILHHTGDRLSDDKATDLSQMESQIQEANNYADQCRVLVQWIEEQQTKALENRRAPSTKRSVSVSTRGSRMTYP